MWHWVPGRLGQGDVGSHLVKGGRGGGAAGVVVLGSKDTRQEKPACMAGVSGAGWVQAGGKRGAGGGVQILWV